MVIINKSKTAYYKRLKRKKTMKTLTLEQKQSNSGSIYDLSSEHYDRNLQFDENENYAIVYPSYLNRDIEYFESIEEAHEAKEEYATIVDSDGNIYGHVGWGEYEIAASLNDPKEGN